MNALRLIVRPTAVLDTCFVRGWYEHRNDTQYQRMFSDRTRALKVEPYYTQEQEEKDLELPTRLWQPVFCDVLEAFESNGYSTVLRISGPAYPQHILRVYQHVTDRHSQHRFFIPELKYLEGGPGYIYGQAAMEYNSRLVRKMLQDTEIDFDEIAMYGVIVPEELAAKYLTLYMYTNEAVAEAIEESLMVYRTVGHFAGLTIITDKMELHDVVDRLTRGLEAKAVIEERP